jgi:zinc transport system substrate-binding protein
MNPMRRRRAEVALLCAVVLAAGCERSDQAPVRAQKPLVVASFYPLYEFARQVAGDRAEVVALVPSGVEPHDWEPTPADVARGQRARVFVYNGAGLEPWMDRLHAEVLPKSTVVVRATEGLPLTTADLPRHGGGGARDPHVWLDPVLAAAQVEAIRRGLAAADPPGAAAYAANAQRYAGALDALHRRFEAGLATCARRDFVVSHAAFAYLARRYHLTPVSIMGLTPEAEPSPAEMAAIVRFMRRQKVTHVFFETLVNTKLAATLAREVGARTLVLNPIEGLTAEQAAAGQTYVTLMDANLANLRTALGCR